MVWGIYFSERTSEFSNFSLSFYRLENWSPRWWVEFSKGSENDGTRIPIFGLLGLVIYSKNFAYDDLTLPIYLSTIYLFICASCLPHIGNDLWVLQRERSQVTGKAGGLRLACAKRCTGCWWRACSAQGPQSEPSPHICAVPGRCWKGVQRPLWSQLDPRGRAGAWAAPAGPLSWGELARSCGLQQTCEELLPKWRSFENSPGGGRGNI